MVAENWRSRRDDVIVSQALDILKEKFKSVRHYGPEQLAIFHDSTDDDERGMHARRAYELVQKLLSLVCSGSVGNGEGVLSVR